MATCNYKTSSCMDVQHLTRSYSIFACDKFMQINDLEIATPPSGRLSILKGGFRSGEHKVGGSS